MIDFTDSAVPAADLGREVLPEARTTPEGSRSPTGPREATVKTVKSRGRGDKPSKKQRALFAEVVGATEFTSEERGKYLDWAATHATRHTMFEYTEWLKMERFRRERASTTEEAA